MRRPSKKSSPYETVKNPRNFQELTKCLERRIEQCKQWIENNKKLLELVQDKKIGPEDVALIESTQIDGSSKTFRKCIVKRVYAEYSKLFVDVVTTKGITTVEYHKLVPFSEVSEVLYADIK